MIGMQKFHAGHFGFQTDADKFTLCAAVSNKRKQVLIVQVHLQFVEIRLEGNGSAGAEVEGFTAGFVAKLAQIVLRRIEQKEGAASVARGYGVNSPEIDIAFLRDGNGSVHVWVDGSEAAAEIVYP